MLNTDNGDVCVQVASSSQCVIYNDNNQQKFDFDRVFDPDSKQQDIFQIARESVIDDVLRKGLNGTIFSYGATCSGKSYTIFGPDNNDQGIIPRTINYIFDYFEKNQSDNNQFFLSISFLELYLERIRDLLDQSKKNLQVLDSDNPVPDASEIQVYNSEQVFDIINKGNAFKVMAPNKINQQSSRSHCILILNILNRNVQTNSFCLSKLFLADLAGSEKISRTEAQGLRLSEAKNINKSLLALGKVVNSLTTKQLHVPYRDSKLTRLLKCSLGGNSKTLLIVHISPTEDALQESLSTLLFASRAKSVKNSISVNQYQNIDHILSQELVRAREVVKQLYYGKKVSKRTIDIYVNSLSDQEFLMQFGGQGIEIQAVLNAHSPNYGVDNPLLSEQPSYTTNNENETNITGVEDTNADVQSLRCSNIELNQLREDQQLLHLLYKQNNYDHKDDIIFNTSDICGTSSDDIFSVIELHNISLLTLKLKMKPNFNQLNNDGYTCLTYAVLIGFYDAVQIMMSNGADCNMRDGNGCLPIQILIMNCKGSEQELATFQSLVRRLDDTQVTNDDGQNLLQLLLGNNQISNHQFRQQLLNSMLEMQIRIHNPHTGWYALMDCVYNKDQKSLETIINYLGSSSTLKSDALNEYGFYRAFHLAIKLQNKFILLTFIRSQRLQQQLVNCQFQGVSALELAFQVQNIDAFEYLLKAGANIEQQLLDNVFLLGDYAFCSIIIKYCKQNVSYDQIFTATLSQGNIKNVELILTKQSYIIDKKTLQLVEQIHGADSKMYQFISKLYQPEVKRSNAVEGDLIRQFESFLSNLVNSNANLTSLANFSKIKQCRNKSVIMQDKNVNYIEFLYLSDYQNAQNVRQIMRVIGVEGLAVAKLKEIVKARRQQDWVQLFADFGL